MTTSEYIDQVIREGRSITIKYVKYSGESSRRTISDIHYSSEYGREYIECYCHLRQERRTFKISRIREIEGFTSSQGSGSAYPRAYTPSSTSSRNEGCYIATMAYGDYDHPQVLILRQFRDEKLLPTMSGRLFVKAYYFISPKLVRILSGHDRINRYIRLVLDRMIASLCKD